MTDDAGSLADIIEAIDAIEGQNMSREQFEAEANLQIWVFHHLRVMGEAMTRISEKLRSAHPEVPWKSVVGMRNVIVHGYDQVRLDLVWMALENDLAALRQQISSILEDLHD